MFVCLLSSNSLSRRLSPKLPRRRTHDILTRSSQHRPSLLRHPDKVAPNHTHAHTNSMFHTTVLTWCNTTSNHQTPYCGALSCLNVTARQTRAVWTVREKMNCRPACTINFPPHPFETIRNEKLHFEFTQDESGNSGSLN